MTNKELNRIQKEIVNENKSTLAGAVKLWCTLFSKQKEAETILKGRGIEYTKATLASICKIAKDKELAISICAQMLPKVDDTFIRFIVVQREYTDKEKAAESNYLMSKQDRETALVSGTTYKPFGVLEAQPYGEKPEPYLINLFNENCFTVKASAKIKTYSIDMVCKCITRWLVLQSEK